MLPLFATGVVDTGGKFAAGINDTSGIGGKLPPVSLTSVANFPRVHLGLQISRKFSTKIKMALMLLSEAWGKMIHDKNQKQKISRQCPFKGTR